MRKLTLLLLTLLLNVAFAEAQITQVRQTGPGVLRCSFNGSLELRSGTDSASPLITRIPCGSTVLLIDNRFGLARVRMEDGREGYVTSINSGQWSIELEPERSAGTPASIIQPGQAAPRVQSFSGGDYRRVEVFGGGALLRPNLPGGITGDDDVDDAIAEVGEFVLGNVTGWGANVTVNLASWFGITGDIGAHYKSLSGEFEDIKGEASLSLYSFMVGPTFKSRAHDRVQPFGRFLIGVGRPGASLSGSQDGARISLDFHENGLAIAAGGGVDIVVNDAVSVRPVEFDYFPYRTAGGDTFTLNNFRWRTGVVFTFGN